MMIDTIQISLKEYEAMKEELALLKNTDLLKKMNRLVDLLYEEKYGLYLGNSTNDLSEASVLNNWQSSNSARDNV